MNCLHPYMAFYDAGDYKVPMMQVPCGRCGPCLKARSAEWATRLLHEQAYWSNSSFVTLTYDDDHAPKNMSLDKEALVKFFKRLRKCLAQQGRTIKYYACGEYGERYHRPHYHAIIFGLSPKDDEEKVKDCWRFGFVSLGTVTPESCRYVTNYILKAHEGGIQGKDYGGLEPPFKKSSQGLGKRYVFENEKQLIDKMFITVNGVKKSLPRYYIKLLGESIDIEKMEKMRLEREQQTEGVVHLGRKIGRAHV